MIDIRIWAMTYGIVILGWLFFACGLGFLISAIWDKGRHAKLTAGLFLTGLSAVLFMYLAAPVNWNIMARLGGL